MTDEELESRLSAWLAGPVAGQCYRKKLFGIRNI